MKKKLIEIRNDLAKLQDSNFEKIQRIEEVKFEKNFIVGILEEKN